MTIATCHKKMRLFRLLCALSAAIICLLAPLAQAQNSPDLAASSAVADAAQRPGGRSFESIDAADKALATAEKERGSIEARYAEQERDCRPKFFTTACLDKAREVRRSALANVRSIEVDARSYKRRAKALQRDKAMQKKADATLEEQNLPTQTTTPPSK